MQNSKKIIIKNYGPIVIPYPSVFSLSTARGAMGAAQRVGGDCGCGGEGRLRSRMLRTRVGGHVHGGDARDGAAQEVDGSEEGRHR